MAFAGVYSADKKDDGFQNSRNEILLRKIGHDLLLSSGDDSSRVMPVQQLSGNRFRIRFQNQLSLLPDSVISIVHHSLASGTFPADYAVSVIDCNAKAVVYGFTVAAAEKDNVLSCQGRLIPNGCYYIDISFSQATSVKQQKLLGYSIAAIAGIFLIGGFAWYKKRKRINAPEEQPPSPVSNLVKIGQYDFNFEQHFLEKENVKTILTTKESKLLYIFARSINQLVDRNSLQEQVWGNEGVIVTRSLDMFVSKLRKKLQDDPAVKIVNFPGKGYKLEVSV